MPSEEVISADAQHVTWSTQSFVRLCQRAKEQGFVPGIAHSHPGGCAAFSIQDERNERDLCRLARNRNGSGTAVASLLLIGEQHFRAHVWTDAHPALDAESVLSVGRKLRFYGGTEPIDDDAWDRQVRALGPALNPVLKRLRTGVVGCGGTGSATAILLARLGVGHLALFDKDTVEETNLNRVHGARRSDVGRAKVEVISREIVAMGLGARVAPLRCWVDDPAARDALRSCDVIFGCTDDHAGRLFLNRFAYFYLRPVIDMGLALEPAPGGGLREVSGRVTVLVPGKRCLVCRGVVDSVIARDETLKRRSPDEYACRKREAYVRGGGDPAPSVVTDLCKSPVTEIHAASIHWNRQGKTVHTSCSLISLTRLMHRSVATGGFASHAGDALPDQPVAQSMAADLVVGAAPGGPAGVDLRVEVELAASDAATTLGEGLPGHLFLVHAGRRAPVSIQVAQEGLRRADRTAPRFCTEVWDGPTRHPSWGWR